METHVRAPLQISQIVAKGMIERKSGGSIVNVSSVLSLRGHRGTTLYGSAKAAQDQMMRTMCLELGKHKIRVNSVNPTVVLTNKAIAYMAKNPDEEASWKSTIPVERLAEIEEVVSVVIFLLSDAASMVSGSCLPVDGGQMASLVT